MVRIGDPFDNSMPDAIRAVVSSVRSSWRSWSQAQRVQLLCGFALASFVVLSALRHRPTYPGGVNVDFAATGACSNPLRNRGVPTFKYRRDLGSILEKENKTVGVELGVQRGDYSREILQSWHSCKEFHLVDLWAPQAHYKDLANVEQSGHDDNYAHTMRNTEPWKDKLRICRNYTSVCVKNVPNNRFDFIYVDARHDFKGVYEDLVSWWPKLKVGGILAGHDYVTQDDGPDQTSQDWTTNYDGTKDETGTVVKGAVDKFALEVCRQVTVAYREGGWNTWAMRK